MRFAWSWKSGPIVASVLTFVIVARAQTTAPVDGALDFGAEGRMFPPVQVSNGVTPRTARLLGEAYQRGEPLEWKRVQYVAELGESAQPAAAPYLVEGMKDAAPAVRAEAARSAAMVGDPSLLAELERLLDDPDADVRCAAVRSATALAESQQRPTKAIERGLADRQSEVIAAAIQSAWLPAHATSIAEKLPALPAELQPDAAAALARLNATDQAAAVLPMLNGDVPQRVAALRALSAIGVAAQADAVTAALSDPHPTVRREAMAAMIKVADRAATESGAIRLLSDPDLTVRASAAAALAPVPSAAALNALAAQLKQPYAPLHEATRNALARPRDDPVRQATIALAAELLSQPDPRRREDASFILGRLHSGAAFEQHVALLNWDPANVATSDWPLIAQAAESVGLIGDGRAAEPLMALVRPAPSDALKGAPQARQNAMTAAMSNALVSLGRLRHKPALEDAIRILKLDPQTSPAPLRTAAAFAVGVLSEPGKLPPGANLLAVYESMYEAHAAKFEALKALGNLRHAPSAERLKSIAESDPSPDLRWIAHWSYERASGTRVPYNPPVERREPALSIIDLPR